ncbi:hypothetical protein JCGZ_18681 [Jatropha curcas]|uniref:Uncharacterized protein n=1 Tax=Jatropha curcas TaxID=180498 RepID=A0A067K0M4_JATCU|nr:hypothetical protein JCGZ_18681 [Jatropha curcas]
MSTEELKIRGELEMDIENDLEQELKDGIYHLALRLHRLYQQQKERNKRETSESHQERSNKILSEINISIKLEGGTKIEIKETKKEASHQKGINNRPRTAKSDQVFQGLLDSKKFDWERSLRSSGSVPIPINKRKTISNYSASHYNPYNARRNLTSAAGLRKGNHANDENNKVLELGWKC